MLPAMKPIAVIQQDPSDPPATLGRYLTAIGRPWELIDAYGGQPIPATLADHSALIAMGGDMNVHQDEEYPFLRDELRLLEHCLAQQLPVLGICLGAQLLAAAAGGSVYKRPYPEIGWVEVERSAPDPLLTGVDSPFVTLQWHDYSFTLPPGAMSVAARPDGEQVFRVGPCAWGTQFHPEVDAELVALWLRQDLARVEALRADWPQEIRAATQVHVTGYEAFCRTLVDNFLAAAADATAAAGEPAGR
jgi:GMP synthase-like glutamine amidotransferase